MGKYLKVIFVDTFSLLIGIISGFLLPKFLDIDSYSVVRTFGLYIGYCSVLHFGFSDGIYIILGGKNLNTELQKKIKGYFYILLKIIVPILCILLVINIFLKNYYLSVFIFYTFPFQINLFLAMIYRALSEFKYYSLMKGLTNIFTLLSIVLCIFYKNSYVYINTQIILQYIIMAIFLIHFYINFKDYTFVAFSEVKYIISLGFNLLIGNLIYNLVFSMDRWFVKILFDSKDFAFYSFGVSMLNLFIVLITSVSVILYPNICKNLGNILYIQLIRKGLLIVSVFSMGGFFFLKLIVDSFLPQYIPSLHVLAILIMCIPFITLINAFYSNLYRAFHRTKRYTQVSFFILICGLIFNSLLIVLFKEPIMLAFGSLFSFIIWYLISSKDFTEFIVNKKEFSWLFACILIYGILMINNQSPFINFILFYCFISFISILCFNKEIKQSVDYLKNSKYN